MLLMQRALRHDCKIEQRTLGCSNDFFSCLRIRLGWIGASLCPQGLCGLGERRRAFFILNAIEEMANRIVEAAAEQFMHHQLSIGGTVLDDEGVQELPGRKRTL